MAEGPLGFRRLTDVGPLVADEGEKEVLGVVGTPFPNRPKGELIMIFILGREEGGNPYTFTDKAEERLRRRVSAREEGVKVDLLKSGSSSAKTLRGEMVFTEQAVVARVKGERLPINESVIEQIEGIIERDLGELDNGSFIKDVIYEVS